MVELHVVSDASGETASRVAAATMRQFPGQQFREVRHPRITSVDDVQLAASRAHGRTAVMFYTLVDPRFRSAMRRVCRRYRLPYCDILRQPISAVMRVSGAIGSMTPDPIPAMDSTYFKRVAAMEFAVRFDDGLAPSALPTADIVLIGVSRTSKTPLSIYLGYLGYKTANVPIVPGIELPAELSEVAPHKVVGLTIDADRLSELRSERIRALRGSRGDYVELVKIYEELDFAKAVHRKFGCPVIDVSDLAIEEAARRVIQLVEQRTSQAGK